MTVFVPIGGSEKGRVILEKYGVKVDPQRGYKRSPLDAANHSRLALDAVMTHRILTDKDFEEIIEDLRRYLNRASDNLDLVEKEGEISSYTRILNLELHVVELLFSRLKRHINDWGDPKLYPELSYLERKRFDEAR